MPIIRCVTNGKKGYKFGKSGKCYSQRNKAIKQGQAISISKVRRARHKIPVRGNSKRRSTIRRLD